MRYHFSKPTIYLSMYGEIYHCNHPVYSSCTLFKMDSVGLAVIQQRYDESTKHTYWTEIDAWLTDKIYLHPRFLEYFKRRARAPIEDIYPTVTIRQIMWALKMKPLKREDWETVFDRREI